MGDRIVIMNAGVIAQVDRRWRCTDQPRQPLRRRLPRQPADELLRRRAARPEGAGLSVVLGGGLRPSPVPRSRLDRGRGRPDTLGVPAGRHPVGAGGGTAPRVKVPAVVEVVEPLGERGHRHRPVVPRACSRSEASSQASCARPAGAAPRSTPTRFHLFDRQTEVDDSDHPPCSAGAPRGAAGQGAAGRPRTRSSSERRRWATCWSFPAVLYLASSSPIRSSWRSGSASPTPGREPEVELRRARQLLQGGQLPSQGERLRHRHGAHRGGGRGAPRPAARRSSRPRAQGARFRRASWSCRAGPFPVLRDGQGGSDSDFRRGHGPRTSSWRVEKSERSPRRGPRRRRSRHASALRRTVRREKRALEIERPRQAAMKTKASGTGWSQDPNFLLSLLNTFKYTFGTEFIKLLIGDPLRADPEPALRRPPRAPRPARHSLGHPNRHLRPGLALDPRLDLQRHQLVPRALGPSRPGPHHQLPRGQDWAMLSVILVNVWRGFSLHHHRHPGRPDRDSRRDPGAGAPGRRRTPSSASSTSSRRWCGRS